MDDQVADLSKIFLNAQPGTGRLRARAAQELAVHWLDVRAFNSLYSVCCYPDVYALESGLVPLAGALIGKIMSDRDVSDDPLKHYTLNPKHFDEFHEKALPPALSALTDDQREVVCKAALENFQCSEVIATFFFSQTFENAMQYERIDPAKALVNAKRAIVLFNKLNKEEKKFEFFFYRIVMCIIAGKRWEEIYASFLDLLKNYAFFNLPTTTFEKYVRFHVMLISKLVCRDFFNIQSLFTQLRSWILQNQPEDEIYITVLEMILKGNEKAAIKAFDELKALPKKDSAEKDVNDFYHSWQLTIDWLLKQKHF